MTKVVCAAKSLYEEWLPPLPAFRNAFGELLHEDLAASLKLANEKTSPSPLSTETSLSSFPSTSSSLVSGSHSRSPSQDSQRPGEDWVAKAPTPRHGKQKECVDDVSRSSSSLSTPMLQDSPLASRRGSVDPQSDSQSVSAFSMAPVHRKSCKEGGAIEHLCMQLKHQHVIYDEVSKGQLPEISIMKSKLNQTLPPLRNGRQAVVEDQMSIRVLEGKPIYIIHGTILLESRKASWRKHSKLKVLDEAAQHRQLPDLSNIDPWGLPIDGSSLLEGNKTQNGGKRMFEFPQYRINAECKKCDAGNLNCARCDGLDSVDCFWCGSTGYFKGHKCKKCKTTGQINCEKCDNSGKVACTSCDGKGAFKWALCVDLRIDSVSLPPVTLEELLSSADGTDSSHRSPELIQRKATQAVYETAVRIFEQSSKDVSILERSKDVKKANHDERKVPVMARCQVESHMQRLLHICRWNREEPGRKEHSRFLHTTGPEEKLVRLDFVMNELESKRLQMLDSREHGRLRSSGVKPVPSSAMQPIPSSRSMPSVMNSRALPPFIPISHNGHSVFSAHSATNHNLSRNAV